VTGWPSPIEKTQRVAAPPLAGRPPQRRQGASPPRKTSRLRVVPWNLCPGVPAFSTSLRFSGVVKKSPPHSVCGALRKPCACKSTVHPSRADGALLLFRTIESSVAQCCVVATLTVHRVNSPRTRHGVQISMHRYCFT
jgi:hypothetical protein